MKKIIVLYCGGTISSKPDIDGVRSASSIDIIEEHKNHSKIVSLLNEIDIIRTDTIYTGLSENITPRIQDEILEKIVKVIESEKNIGILLTFGSDSIVGMSKAIYEKCYSYVHKNNINFVITGANDDTTVKDSDAWGNLDLSFTTLSEDRKGIFVCFSNKVIPAKRVERLPFDGLSMKLGDSSELSYWKEMCASKSKKDSQIQSLLLDYGVSLYYVNKISIKDHNEFLLQVKSKKSKIVIFVLYHSGTANAENCSSSISDLIKTLVTEYGIICFGASENDEPVTLNSYITGVKLRESGLIPLYNMSYSSALIKAGLLLAENRKEIITEMLRNFSGEIDETLVNRNHIETLKRIYTWTK